MTNERRGGNVHKNIQELRRRAHVAFRSSFSSPPEGGMRKQWSGFPDFSGGFMDPRVAYAMFRRFLDKTGRDSPPECHFTFNVTRGRSGGEGGIGTEVRYFSGKNVEALSRLENRAPRFKATLRPVKYRGTGEKTKWVVRCRRNGPEISVNYRVEPRVGVGTGL